jgi:hypothetical protein
VNRRILTLAAAGAAAAFAVALPLTAAPKGTTHTAGSSPHTQTCDDGTVTVFAPTSMWPPNHKYDTTLYVEAVATDSTQEIILESHGYHEQYVEDSNEELNGSGGGNGTNAGDDITSDDATATPSKLAHDESDSGYPEAVASETGTGTVHTDWKARAERSGRDQTGRTYTLSGTATFSDGDDTTEDPTCTMTWNFSVPHDMRSSTRS